MKEINLLVDDEQIPELKLLACKYNVGKYKFIVQKLSERSFRKTHETIEKHPVYSISNQVILGTIPIKIPSTQLSIELMFRYLRQRDSLSIKDKRILPNLFVAFDYSDYELERAKYYSSLLEVVPDGEYVETYTVAVLLDLYVNGVPFRSTYFTGTIDSIMTLLETEVKQIKSSVPSQNHCNVHVAVIDKGILLESKEITTYSDKHIPADIFGTTQGSLKSLVIGKQTLDLEYRFLEPCYASYNSRMIIETKQANDKRFFSFIADYFDVPPHL